MTLRPMLTRLKTPARNEGSTRGTELSARGTELPVFHQRVNNFLAVNPAPSLCPPQRRFTEYYVLRTCNKICNEWDQRHSNNNTFIINEYNLHPQSE